MKAIAKDVDGEKDFSPNRGDNSIHRVRDAPERQIGYLGDVIGNIRHNGGAPSVDSIATQLSGMHSTQRTPALLALQQTHGNRYVQRVVSGIQAKLVVGQPGDIYEQEADRVADAVMRMPEPGVQWQAGPEEEEELIQTKALSEQIMPLVQRQEGNEKEEEIQTKPLPSQTSEVASDVETSINSIRGGGQPLPGSTRAFFEPRFGQDFSQVRVHTDARAADVARAVNARAFTVGHDVVFGEGQYAPGKSEGRRLLAHELTHTIQQDAVGTSDKADTIDAQQSNLQVSSFVDGIQRQQKAPKAKSSTEIKADFVKEQVKLDRFIDFSESLSEGEYGPPEPGGAFWMLNGLNPNEMIEVLHLCGKDTRTKLLSHIADTEGRFDMPRLESALRSSAWGEKVAGTTGLEIMDAIRNAKPGSFASVWTLMAGKSRVKAISALRTLPRYMLTLMQSKLSDAPATDVNMFREVLTDLLGTGTSMQANDVIDIEGLSGIERTMASIYNMKGQLIEEQARNLGIATHAAAAIMKAESGGATFSEQTNKTIIRFENHVFWREWGSSNVADFKVHFDFNHAEPHKQHRIRYSSTGTWGACHRNQSQEWRIIEFAASLSSKESAYRSASWGAGQIMGFNAALVGYSSAVDMADAFNRAERPQVTGIFEFIRANNLTGAIISGDYHTVAMRYNGRGKAQSYAADIQTAAQSYQRVTRNKIHVIT